MTDQADALAGKLADVPKRHSVECRARGGDPCECFGYPDYDAMVVVATAHFAEEIAKVRADVDAYSAENFMLKEQAEERSNAIDTYIRVHLANKDKIATLTAENERLKGELDVWKTTADSYSDVLDDLRATLARVREGLTRENLVQVLMARYPRAETMYYDMAGAILALLAPEGNQ